MRLRFVLGRALNGLVKNFSTSVAVIIVTFISLLFVGLGGLTQIQVTAMQKEWYSKVEVSVYMCAQGDSIKNCAEKEATEAQIKAVRDELEKGDIAPYVSRFTYQDRSEVYADFQRQFGDSVLGQATSADMMPSAFRIKLKDPEYYRNVADQLTGQPGVATVQNQAELVQPLLSLFRWSTQISWGLALLMSVAAVLLITTTIRLSALRRQKETQILRMTGASALFIQLPFMLEGAIAALLGAAAACGALAAGVHFIVQGWLQHAIPFISFVNLDSVWLLSGVLVGGAILLSMLASMISLAKYAKL